MKKIWKILISILLLLATAVVLFSVFDHHAKKKTTIELFEFKPESTATFQTLINQFEKKNPNIHVELSAPGDAYTVLKARIVKGKIPDLIGLGGEQYYVDYAKANIFKNLSNDSMIKKFNPTYIKGLQYLEKSKKIYGVPYVANVSGVLYNKDLFKKDGLTIPQNWQQFIALCQKLKSQGKTPLYLGYKDDWTILQAFNPLAGNLMKAKAFDISSSNIGKYNSEYELPLARLRELSKYSQGDVFSYNYNDATTAFAQGKSYMYLQGNWAIPLIKQVNSKINLGMFTFPAKDSQPSKSVSGIDLVFSISKQTKHYAATKKLLEYLISKKAYTTYLNQQFALSTLKKVNVYPASISGVVSNLKKGKITMSPQYMYPTELDMAGLLQTNLVSKNKTKTFLNQLNQGLRTILGPSGEGQ
ncbi:ABC transporter substrate-binding protein [Oenococcus sicerae]|uniref:Extracellular solute-binding protein n=1 Tax=Oenococcus sicerae TaxID=2203724 RepID=A0AAJ1RCZ6_9LACO|nr:extracellular solute-binding protein [Oenococcus sicerae]MDN6900705.1 extracellular solute-binding protein [Oenococcus sicerae]